MKKNLKLTALSAVLLMFAGWFISCDDKKKEIETENPCNSKRPTNLKPIDWENYNDVHTFSLYYRGKCEEEAWLLGDEGKTINVSGWMHQNMGWWETQGKIHFFTLIDNKADIYIIPYGGLGIFISTEDPIVAKELYDKVIMADVSKKMHLRGTLSFSMMHIDGIDFGCCIISASITLQSVDDIYFE